MGMKIAPMILYPLPSGIEDFLFTQESGQYVMKLKLNGEEYITDADTMARLLKELKIIPGRVAVEVNLTVIRKKDFEDYRLKDGDSVEIVYFVGGGQNRRKHGRLIDH
jgi:thiamine biosynthesis protein ThiS